MINKTKKEEWEEKRVSPVMDRDYNFMLEHRDWLLGGKTFQWKIYNDKATNELVLQRK
jgi:hypothetical protein